MRPGGTNLRAFGDLRFRSQTPYPYDAYPPAPRKVALKGISEPQRLYTVDWREPIS